jgi:hypothetical protein
MIGAASDFSFTNKQNITAVDMSYLPSAMLDAPMFHSLATVVILSPFVTNRRPTCPASIPCSDPATKISQQTFFWNSLPNRHTGPETG